MTALRNRTDLIQMVNSARFYLRHYARGLYPLFQKQEQGIPVNRIFFPLCNPGGQACHIRDHKRILPLTPGCMYFIPAFYPVAVNLDERLSFFSIQSNLEILPGTELFSGCSRMLELPLPSEYPALLELFDSAPAAQPFSALKCASLAFSLLVSLIEHYPDEDFRNVLSLRQYSGLTEYLREHGSAETRVSDLANLSKESREGFTRRFRSRTGMTPKQMIDRFLVGKIIDQLASDASLKEIAYRLKFSTEFVFSRYVRRHLGESPSSWRERAVSARF